MFKQKLSDLADESLATYDIKTEYSDVDLMNATIILSEVLFSKMYDKMKDTVTPEQAQEIAEQVGRDLHDLFLQHTGVDLHKTKR